MSDNVIKGPWGSTPPSTEKLSPDEENNLIVHALTVELCEALFDGIVEAGIDNLEELEYSKDLALIVQSVKSAIFKMQGEDHVLQGLAESIFDWTPDGFVELIDESSKTE